MRKLLYVVQRYFPYPGGSEYFVQAMAEESLRRGYNVTVLAECHEGDQGGVKVTSDAAILKEYFDLIIVHNGYSMRIQNIVLSNAHLIKSKILYLLIEPWAVHLHGAAHCDCIGWSTPQDLKLIEKLGLSRKAGHIRHGIHIDRCIGKPGFKNRYNIKTGRLFVSAGGFLEHKGMQELKNVFSGVDLKDTTLVLIGHDERWTFAPKEAGSVRVLKNISRQDVLDAIFEANLYVMNSTREGFGLVLLEAMLNKTPWVARNIAGAAMLAEYGAVYNNTGELRNFLASFDPESPALRAKIEKAHDYVLKNFSVKNTVDDIEAVISKIKNSKKVTFLPKLTLFALKQRIINFFSSAFKYFLKDNS